MDIFNSISDAIIFYGPSIVSIITMICTIIVAIKRVTSTTKDSVSEIKRASKVNNDLKNEIAELLHENAQLKDDLRSCMNKMNNITEADHGK